ncbi:hypothetical protein [Chitinophaga pinensis]|uniref:Lipocalin-like domain-containing protein n=1 Tax=Chitinophaga pinensis (strain ATCC 43595 / DSM 2588 / LMG 13176 / NBRC 15968 / NCIMB 11800 / UQM 2034) TaxID=485918 RepID=A0A979FYX1_CHIPD|nr:hypothetical protein [Chitinophaga pinensis]ACU57671.1 hypothetical protein Cpin_0170 [Chitinophaga pinensis DSM 2588]
MRSLLTSLLLLMLFCSCEKNDIEATPSIDVTGSWQLSQQLSMPDTAWQTIGPKDSAYYIFGRNGQFVFDAKSYHLSGTYKVIPAGKRVNLIITGQDSVTQYLQVERLTDTSIRVDDWLIGVTKEQISRQFILINK